MSSGIKSEFALRQTEPVSPMSKAARMETVIELLRGIAIHRR